MGYLHIYCGDGKGKTTAAFGLAVRAAGAGMNVHIAQLLKGSESAEVDVLRKIARITLSRCDRDYGFTFNMSDEDKRAITECHNRLIEGAFASGADIIILDEFNAAYNCGLLNRKRAEELILQKKAEIVLTGRDPAEIFCNAADYYSEIKCVRHPYEKGISARIGIEY